MAQNIVKDGETAFYVRCIDISTLEFNDAVEITKYSISLFLHYSIEFIHQNGSTEYVRILSMP